MVAHGGREHAVHREDPKRDRHEHRAEPEHLRDGVERARAKLEYTGYAAALCGKTATIADLHAVYEAVWGVALDRANFHRKVLSVDGFVEETGDSRVGRGRPAKLCRRGSAQTIYPPLTRASVREARARS